MRTRAGLDSMALRVFLLLCVGVVAAAALAFSAADLQRRAAEGRDREQRLVERATDLVTALRHAPAQVRPQLLGDGPEAARLVDRDGDGGEPVDADLTARLGARLGASAAVRASIPSPATCAPAPPSPLAGHAAPPPPVRPPLPAPPRPPERDCRRLDFTLDDGERLGLVLPAGPRARPPAPTPFSPLMLAVLAAAAAALAFVTARLATAPLRRLAGAAEALGRDLERPPLADDGPAEVRQAARAFNAMQAQLRRRQAERTYMLAAITHDLQTPLTRLRLRAAKVADAELREALLADQAAMLQLVRDGLDLARTTAGDGAPMRDLDVDSLLQSLCEDAVEAGGHVAVTARCGARLRTHPAALKRCVANLIDNALKYAGAAELLAERRDGGLELLVRDRGPGVPSADLHAVLEPFVRLETSRSRETGGVGLGLTIARLMAERAGGELRLEPRDGGGLSASVRFGPQALRGSDGAPAVASDAKLLR